MAAFASDRRSGWVRVLVLILCALFIFATIATPPAYAAGETVALFGLAAVLSAATAALGFKLANNADGQATLQKMVQDFAGASIAAGLVLTGTKVNGLINGMQYIKMAVHNGKTYLDERVAAWCQQWLADHGVYSSSSISFPSYQYGETVDFVGSDAALLCDVLNNYISNDSFYGKDSVFSKTLPAGWKKIIDASGWDLSDGSLYRLVWDGSWEYIYRIETHPSSGVVTNTNDVPSVNFSSGLKASYFELQCDKSYNTPSGPYSSYQSIFFLIPRTLLHGAEVSNFGAVDSSFNDTGLSGTDTLGEDYVNKTLEQILAGLKEWAQDWFDAGADSVTNAATGAKDLPLSVATGAATLNPDIADDGPLVWFPAFDWPLGKLRSGETDTKTVDQGKENASAAETATTDVAENQTVIDSLVNWALGYISPDTGLFSKFPLCVPYDAYLLACASLGVDVVESDSIFSASPDDLSSIVQTGSDQQSEGFTPVITISNDLTLDGYTYPLKLTIDLTDWTPLIKFVRLAISITVIAELIGAEYKRIKGK